MSAGATTSGEHLLVVEDLRLEAGAGLAPVRDASLVAARGETVGLVGESGSGKSLTLRAISGLLPSGVHVADGSIDVAGLEVVGASPQQVRRLCGETVGMIFQEPMTALNPTMRIGAQIAEAAASFSDLPRSAAKARALELLERVGFTDPARQARAYPHELSGGMRQRVVIAIALAGNPQLLLCDEPTTALDATVTMRILDLIVGLVADLDLGAIMVTHDLGVAARVCDRIVVMYAGRVVEEGPTDELLRRPCHPYTLALLQAVPTREREISDLRSIPGAPPSPGDDLPGCPFAPRCDFSTPECVEPVELVPIGNQRSSACIHHGSFIRDGVETHD
jgi:oligopeptide/dipeptide ABC transporter ATP-binding protein